MTQELSRHKVHMRQGLNGPRHPTLGNGGGARCGSDEIDMCRPCVACVVYAVWALARINAGSSKEGLESIWHPLCRLIMETLHRSSGVLGGGLRIAPAGLARPCRVIALRRKPALVLRKGRHAPAITALRHVTGHEKVGASVRVNEKASQCTKGALMAPQLSLVQCAATGVLQVAPTPDTQTSGKPSAVCCCRRGSW